VQPLKLFIFKFKSGAAMSVLFSVVAIQMSVVSPASGTPIKLGVYVASQGQVGAPEDARVLDSYAQMVGRRPDIVMDYSNITEPLLTPAAIANLQARSETPMVTWQLYRAGWSGPTIPLQEIAAGSYDTYLRSAADLAKSLPFEVMIRFAHEMNGSWYGWSGDPSAYVEAWRHVVDVFRQQGADNVKWVWAPNVDNGRYPFSAYFPGDSWVDYTALDGYNWGTAGIGANRWESLYQVFASSYGEITQLSAKPVIISETASGEGGGDKADWIRQGFLTAIPQEFPRVAAVIWFDRNQEEDWRIDSSPASLNAYREVVASSLYGGPNPRPGASTPAGTAVTALEVTPSKTIVGSRPGKHAKAAARSRLSYLFYRLSQRAGVRIAVRALGRRRGPTFSMTIRRSTLMGHFPLSKMAGKNRLPQGAYIVTATAIARSGAVSKSLHTRFRIIRGTSGCRRRRCASTKR
jgi:hypothetical protein